MANLYFEFSEDEIKHSIPYALICETRESSVWNTMKRKRAWAQQFTDAERDAASRIFSQAHAWTLTTGVPDKVKMSTRTYELWRKIAAFCASI